MARIYKTRTWHDQFSPSMEELEFLALESYAHLPEEFRKLTGEAPQAWRERERHGTVADA